MTRYAVGSLVCLLAAAGCGEPGADGVPGLPGPNGPPGPDAPPNEPALAAVAPARAVLDRTIDVVLTVTALTLDENASVSFGDDIEVSAIEVSAPQELTVTAVVGPQAEVGQRNVTVTTSDGEVSGAFEVVPALEALTIGTFDPGGLFQLDIENQDDIPFDVATFDVAAPGIATVVSVDRTATSFSSVALVAPSAAAGPTQLVGTNYYAGDVRETFLSAVGAVTVGEREPVDIEDSHVGTLPVAGETGLYRHAPATFTGFVDVSLSRPEGATGDPVAWAFGPSGDFDALLGLFQGRMPIPVHESAQSFFVVTDNEFGGGPGYSHELTFTHVPAQLVIEQTAAHGDLPGQSVAHCVAGSAVTPCLTDGSLADALELDVYRIEGIAAAGIEVILESEVPMAAFAQNGALTALDPWANELYDPWTYAPMVVTDQKRHLAYYSTWGDYPSWTLIIASATGKTGSYRLGVRPRP